MHEAVTEGIISPIFQNLRQGFEHRKLLWEEKKWKRDSGKNRKTGEAC
jgi:hypothetical protein